MTASTSLGRECGGRGSKTVLRETVAEVEMNIMKREDAIETEGITIKNEANGMTTVNGEAGHSMVSG